MRQGWWNLKMKSRLRLKVCEARQRGMEFKDEVYYYYCCYCYYYYYYHHYPLQAAFKLLQAPFKPPSSPLQAPFKSPSSPLP